MRRTRLAFAVDIDHPSWRDIERGLEALEFFQTLIGEQRLKFEPEITPEERKDLVEAVTKVRRGVRYLRRRLYSVPEFRSQRQSHSEDQDDT